MSFNLPSWYDMELSMPSAENHQGLDRGFLGLGFRVQAFSDTTPISNPKP